MRRLNPANGLLQTVAGTGTYGNGGDGGPATSAMLSSPQTLTIDSAGNIFIGDQNVLRVRRVAAATGIMSTVVGGAPASDGVAGTGVSLLELGRVAVDAAGNAYVVERLGQRIRKIAVGTGTMTMVAGRGEAYSDGDGGSASAAGIGYPSGIAFDRSGNLLFAESSRLRRIDAATGIITTIAGGTFGSGGDGGPAAGAQFGFDLGLAVDGLNNIYLADADNLRVRRIDAATGVIRTVAGSGSWGFSGDGGPATAAKIGRTSQIAVDVSGNLYISDYENARIRKVDAATAIITTIAGTGTWGFAGDGGPAISAQTGWTPG